LLVEGDGAIGANVVVLMHLTKGYFESCLEHKIQFQKFGGSGLGSHSPSRKAAQCPEESNGALGTLEKGFWKIHQVKVIFFQQPSFYEDDAIKNEFGHKGGSFASA
jgi:hypothetical protein